MTETNLMNVSGTLHESSGSLEPGSTVRLRASHCPDCDRWEFPGRVYCPACPGKPRVEALSETAEIIGFSAVLHQPPGALVQAPYSVALAAFPEGVAVLGTVGGVAYDQLSIGDRVTTVATVVGGSIEYSYALCEKF